MLKCLRLRRAFFLLGFLNIAACLSADAAAAYTVKRGVAIPVEGLPLEGIIKSVSNNDTGDIIIGGNSIDVDSISPVAYKVVGNIATVVSGLPKQGAIRSVSMSRTGKALIGGYEDTGPLQTNAIAYTVTGNIATSLGGDPLPKGYITTDSVSMKDQLNGIIGGSDIRGPGNGFSYKVSRDSATAISITADVIETVAASSSGRAVIGGYNYNGGDCLPVAYQITGTSPASLTIPMTYGIINSVSISDNDTDGKPFIVLAGQSQAGMASGTGAAFTVELGSLEAVAINNLASSAYLSSAGINNNQTPGEPYIVLAGYDKTGYASAYIVNFGSRDAVAITKLPKGKLFSASISDNLTVGEPYIVLAGEGEAGEPIAFTVNVGSKEAIPVINLPRLGLLTSASINKSGDIILGGSTREIRDELPLYDINRITPIYENGLVKAQGALAQAGLR